MIPEKDPESISPTLQRLEAGILALNAHRKIAVSLFRKLGFAEIDGVDIDQWWDYQFQQRMNDELMDLESVDPEAAARMHEFLKISPDYPG